MGILGRFQFRRDTTANWAAANPILLSGELGLDQTLGLIKIGDGSTPWLGLAFVIGGVNSVFGRTNIVTAEVGDYSAFYDALGAATTALATAEKYATAMAIALG